MLQVYGEQADPLSGEVSVDSRAEISDLLVLSDIHFAESAHRYVANLRSLSRRLAEPK